MRISGTEATEVCKPIRSKDQGFSEIEGAKRLTLGHKRFLMIFVDERELN